METLKAAVIGVGAMGANHARIYNSMTGTELAAVSDVFEKTANAVADNYRTKGYTDYKRMLKEIKPDVVTITTPTQWHTRVALDCIGAGCDVLVEKPIADTKANAQKIIDAAKKEKKLLMVGHIERFNPAVIELKKRLDKKQLGKVFTVHATRVGPFPHRIRDVGVVVDLAVHDIDIMRHLLRSDVKHVYAETEKRVHTSCEDMVSGLMKFKNGAVGVLDINWLTPEKFRWIKVIGEKGMYVVRYIPQELIFYENKVAKDKEYTYQKILMGVKEGDIKHIRINKKEPLRTELEEFVKASKARGTKSPVTGQDGLKALEIAQAIIKSGSTSKVIRL